MLHVRAEDRAPATRLGLAGKNPHSKPFQAPKQTMGLCSVDLETAALGVYPIAPGRHDWISHLQAIFRGNAANGALRTPAYYE
jgi:hypothetical protein